MINAIRDQKDEQLLQGSFDTRMQYQMIRKLEKYHLLPIAEEPSSLSTSGKKKKKHCARAMDIACPEVFTGSVIKFEKKIPP